MWLTNCLPKNQNSVGELNYLLVTKIHIIFSLLVYLWNNEKLIEKLQIPDEELFFRAESLTDMMPDNHRIMYQQILFHHF